MRRAILVVVDVHQHWHWVRDSVMPVLIVWGPGLLVHLQHGGVAVVGVSAVACYIVLPQPLGTDTAEDKAVAKQKEALG